MTPEQARAARAILKIGVRDVAEAARITPNTVSRLEQNESGPRGAQPAVVEAVRRFYESRGILFLDQGDTTGGGPGVRLRGGEVAGV